MLVWISPVNLRTHAPRQRSGDTSPGPGLWHMASRGMGKLLWNTTHVPLFRLLNGCCNSKTRWSKAVKHCERTSFKRACSPRSFYCTSLLSSVKQRMRYSALSLDMLLHLSLVFEQPQQLFIHSELQNVCPEGYQCASLWQWSHQQRSCSDFRRLNQYIRMYFVNWFGHVYI